MDPLRAPLAPPTPPTNDKQVVGVVAVMVGGRCWRIEIGDSWLSAPEGEGWWEVVVVVVVADESHHRGHRNRHQHHHQHHHHHHHLPPPTPTTVEITMSPSQTLLVLLDLYPTLVRQRRAMLLSNGTC